MKTRVEIADLKRQWTADPAWDIEDTEGFEEYREELADYRATMETQWQRENEQAPARAVGHPRQRKRLAVTTRTAQRRILEAATRDGSLHTLYWYVCARRSNFVYAVSVPGAHVPVVPVAPDPEETRHWAHLLLEFVRSANPGLDVALDLTAADLLAGYAWYDWASRADWDTICATCGSVRPAAVAHCPLCQPELGLIRRIEG